ncbi:uncharacterized protein LOC134164170 isoform X2 [Pezoporus occidentalis]|uniref:uncharacterized protein LOC134164170 isoform X2 n=1 Tax=Pezoporus occidentalis TaxID=407982 RepID=UPI002F90A935
MLGQKTNLSRRIREMRASIALQGAAPPVGFALWAGPSRGLLVPASSCMVPTAPQCPAGQARKLYSKPQEEKFTQNLERLPQLREAVQEDIYVLGLARKHELTVAEACGAEQPLGIALASKPLEVGQEKLRAEVCRQVNTCNMLLYQVEQRSRAKERLQRRLQQLQDVQRAEKQQQAQVPGPLPGVAAPVGGFSQPCPPGWALVSVDGLTPCLQPSLPQVVRTLEGNIEKIQTKVRAGQKVTALYVAVRDALRKELAHLPLHLDLLSEMAELQHREVEDMELMASRGLRAVRGAKVRPSSRAPRGAFLPSRAHTWHQMAVLLSLPSFKKKQD